MSLLVEESARPVAETGSEPLATVPSSPTLSIVVPVLDEAESLPRLYDEIVAALDDDVSPTAWELIFVDDGSRDESPTSCIRRNHAAYVTSGA